jgi:hypothetical protein
MNSMLASVQIAMLTHASQSIDQSESNLEASQEMRSIKFNLNSKQTFGMIAAKRHIQHVVPRDAIHFK